MKYRKLTADGDYSFGKGIANFFSNSPEAVAQAIQTALQLVQGEWFLDVNAGVPYQSKVFGMGTKASYDLTIQSTVLNVSGVLRIAKYSSQIDPATRRADVACIVDTVYGSAAFTLTQKPFNYSQTATVGGGRLDTTFILDQSLLA